LEEETATFQHYGISPWEIEVIYDTLKRSFKVGEEQLEPDDPQYVSMIEIGLPKPFDELFFQVFTTESWFKIKGVIKDIKRRRGRKGLKAFLKFTGSCDNMPAMVFQLLAKGDRQFELSIEKLEYIVDIVAVQLRSIPAGTEEVWFSYDEISSKWSPSMAKVNDTNYFFKNNEWKAK